MRKWYKINNMKDDVESVIFFTLQDEKFVTKNGKEITTDFLMNHRHYISEDVSFVILPSTTNSSGIEKDDFICYEIWRPNIPDNGCTKQCNECLEKHTEEAYKGTFDQD